MEGDGLLCFALLVVSFAKARQNVKILAGVVQVEELQPSIVADFSRENWQKS